MKLPVTRRETTYYNLSHRILHYNVSAGRLGCMSWTCAAEADWMDSMSDQPLQANGKLYRYW